MGNALVAKVLDFIGMGDDGHASEDLSYEQSVELRDLNKNKELRIHSTSGIGVVITRPSSYNDILSVCDNLKQKKVVIVDLKDLEIDTAQRCMDFACGTTYVLGGSIQKISPYILLLTPGSVTVSIDKGFDS